MKRIFLLLGIFLLNISLYSQCCTNGKNMLINGDFEDTMINDSTKPIGFTTDNKWNYSFPSPGLYILIKSRAYGACFQSPQFDKTNGNGTGQFLWYDIDNSRTINDTQVGIAWKPQFVRAPGDTTSLITVKKNTNYIFSCYIRDLAREQDCITGGAPVMGLRINKKDMGKIDLGLIRSPCCPDWVQLCTEWYSGNDTLADIAIESRSNAGFTDLGIDDVYFGSSIIPYSIPKNFIRDTTVCNNKPVTFTLPKNVKRAIWNDGNTSFSRTFTKPGTYSVTIFDSCNKSTTDTAIISNILLPTIFLKDTSICKGDSAFYIIPNTFTNVRVNNSSSTNKLYLKNAGNYLIEFTDVCNNIIKANITINFIPVTSFKLIDSLICFGEEIALGTNTPYLNYRWNTGQNSAIIKVRDSGMYILQTTDFCKNMFVDTSVIKTKICRCNVYFPNAFTPNSNNLNEKYFPISDCDFKEIELKIYNRWGQKIWETHDNNSRGWDGIFMGKPVPVGVYVYLAVIKNKVNKKYYRGNITLLR